MIIFEQHAIEMVKQLVPSCTKIEFEAYIGDTSYRVKFFAWINGERKQCYELADSGLIDEQKMGDDFSDYVDFVRNADGYKKEEQNLISFIHECSSTITVHSVKES